MKTPAMAKRLIGQLPKTSGTLTDKQGRSVPVTFSLAEWHFYVGEIPALRTADGELEFLHLADAFDMRDVDEGVTLEGGGIRAEISMLSLRAFSVVGGYIHDAPIPGPGLASQPSEMFYQ